MLNEFEEMVVKEIKSVLSENEQKLVEVKFTYGLDDFKNNTVTVEILHKEKPEPLY